MDQHLKDLFERELAAEPPMPPGSAAGDAMAAGARLRRRSRVMTVGGTVAAAVVVAIAVGTVFGDPLHRGPAVPADAQLWCPVPVEEPHHPRTYTQGRDQVAVFLTEDVTHAQRIALDEMLKSDPSVAISRYQSREETFQRFTELWKGQSDVAKSVPPAKLREAFRVTLRDPDGYPELAGRLRAVAGVADVVGQDPAQCTRTRPGARG
jgi:hypothetical protein